MDSRISIVVPVFNIEKYIERCLKSLINQSVPIHEIILVDDGSTDNSGDICDFYANKYNNIKVIHKENGGLGYARNSGIEKATGDYIAFVDGDDYISVNRIENMLLALKKNNSDSCLAGHTRITKNSNIVKENPEKNKVYSDRKITQCVIPRMLGNTPGQNDAIEMSSCMVVYSKKIIDDHCIRFPSEREIISEDLVFNISYFSHSNCVCISDDVGYYYCDNEGSLTNTYRKDRFEKQVVLYNYLCNKVSELGLYEESKARLMNTLLAITRYSIKLEYENEPQNGKKIAKSNIKSICNNDVLINVLSEFSNKRLPLKNRIVNLLIKYRVYILLRIVMKYKIKHNI